MDTLRLIEIIFSKDNISGEKYIENLCNDLIRIGNTVQDLSVHENEIASTVCSLNALLQYHENQHYLNLFNKSTNEIIRQAFCVVWNFYNHSIASDSRSIKLFLIACLRTPVLSTETLNYCKLSVLEKFGILVQECYSNGDNISRDIALNKSKIFALVTNCSTDVDDTDFVISVFKKLTNAICSTTSYDGIFLAFTTLLRSYWKSLLTKKVENHKDIKECFSSIQVFIQDLCTPILHHLFLSTAFAEVLKKSMFTEEIAICITIFQTLFDFELIHSQENDICHTFLTNFLSKSMTWFLIQLGTFHNVPSVRKKSASTLKSLVQYLSVFPKYFCITWRQISEKNCNLHVSSPIISLTSENFSEVLYCLNSYAQICEVLEESQIHIVKPVVAKILHLFDEKTCHSCLPFSWMFPILQRMFTHESKLVQKEGLLLCLNSNFEERIMQEENSFSFLCVGVIGILREDFLYFQNSRSDAEEEHANSDIHLLLKHFIKSCCQRSSQPQKFLKSILHSVSSHTWSPSSLLYFCDALRHVPSCLAWDDDDKFAIRKLIVDTIRTHHITVRSKIKECLIESFMIHCNYSLVYLDEFLQLLLECRKDNAAIRGSILWNKTSSFLVEVFLQMKHFLKSSADTSLTKLMLRRVDHMLSVVGKSDSNERNQMPTPQHVALNFCLIVDGLCACKDLKTTDDLIRSTLSMVSDVTDKAAVHLYMPQGRIKSAFSFIECILEIVFNPSPSSLDVLCNSLITPCIKILDGMLEYASRRIPSCSINFYDGISCLTTIEKLAKFLFVMTSPQQKHKLLSRVATNLSALIKSSAVFQSKLIKDESLNKEVVGAVLQSSFCMHFVLKLRHTYSLVLDKAELVTLTGYLQSLDLNGKSIRKEDGSFKEEWAQLCVEYSDLHWVCVPYIFHRDMNLTIVNTDSLLQQLIEQMDFVSGKSLVCLFTACRSLLQKVKSDMLTATCMEKMWKLCCESFHASSFRALYKEFVVVCFQSCFLCSSPGTAIHQTLSKIFSEICFHSKFKFNLLFDVIVVCKDFWLSSEKTQTKKNSKISASREGAAFCDRYNDKNNESKIFSILPSDNQSDECILSVSLVSALEYIDFIMHCLTYSPVRTKDMLSTQQAIARIGGVSNEVSSLDEDSSVCLVAASFLLSLNTTSSEHVKFGNIVLFKLLEEDERLTKEKSRYHLNSVTHLTKQKIWQNIIMLHPFVREADSEDLINTLAFRLAEDMQASVRHLVEWCLVLLLCRFPQLHVVLACKLRSNVARGSSNSAISSYLSVLLMCGTCKNFTSSTLEQEKFLLDLIGLVMPWCMSQHFTIRLYGHAVLHRISKHFKDADKLEMLNSRSPTVAACLEFADQSTGNVVKNWERIKEHFMLFKLDPLEDYSLETIFISLPTLCRLEAPTMEALEMSLADSWLPLHNQRDNLRKLSPSAWIASSGKNQRSERVNASNSTDHLTTKGELNLQKKIVVSDQPGKTVNGALVLVASLIDKPSNLGGLTRTCEVFGAERMLVNSLSCVEDRLFQSLAVTAHKWVSMVEVKAFQLESYLKALRGEGFTIVGVEQTELSASLARYKFPEKSAIILGNEKEGIPPHLLPILDVCVEIPQMGFVRSLNVHVSGAVVMWEYRKQHPT